MLKGVQKTVGSKPENDPEIAVKPSNSGLFAWMCKMVCLMLHGSESERVRAKHNINITMKCLHLTRKIRTAKTGQKA
jgi:hypothetical protein